LGTTYPPENPAAKRESFMYIGVGTLVFILIVIVIVLALRR
jgi:hypothetical protein